MCNKQFSAICLGVALALAPAATQAQQLLYELDFEDELPGPGLGLGMYEFHGDAGLTTWSNEIIETSATNQAYRQSADPAPDAPYWYSGGGGPGAVTPAPGETIATGPGSNDAGSYRFSADVLFTGATVAAPVGFSIDQFDPDYETFFAIDANGDGDMLDGANTFKIEVRPTLAESPNFQTVSFFLDVVPATGSTGVVPANIGFDNTLNLSWAFFFGGAEFGIDTGNTVTLDNIKFEFVPPSALTGDFDNDGDVDGADFLEWQRGNSPEPSSPTDLADWKDNFGATGITPTIASVPEPASVVLAIAAAAALSLIGGRRRN